MESKASRNLVIGAVLLSALALGAGYWWGHTMGSREHGPRSTTRTGVAASDEPRILYYRNPMGLDDTSPVPKKDPMGMDYIPVYEGAVPDGSRVTISIDRLQKLGVRTEPAASRTLSRTIRAVGTIEASERGLYTVSPKFEGWITTLYVDTTGSRVSRGQPMLSVYSRELVTAQEEYRIATQTLDAMNGASPDAVANMRALVEGGLQRLRNWDIADEDLVDLRAGKPARHSLPLRSPVNGVVIEKLARAGMRFMPGDPLFQIADLSNVWLIADVFEQDIDLVTPDQAAVVTFSAYPGRTFSGKVTFVYPTVQAETRTGRVRIELPNETGLLKPDLYGTVELEALETVAAISIPESAVLDTGTRRIVLIDLGEGVFEPREVELGARGNDHVAVTKGVAEGERVVIDGNFLIDAESNLKAALGTLGGHAAHGSTAPTSEATETRPESSEAERPATANEHAGH